MSGYELPDGTYVSASWESHKDRTPPSAEPGTDYGCAYGTPLYAADPGTVYATYGNTGPGGRIVEVRLDDGRTVRYLHLSAWQVSPGQRVGRGQRVATSGASGNGSDYFYGPHVHTTLLGTYTTPLYDSIDFAKYAGDAPAPEPEPEPEPEEDDDMAAMKGASYTRSSDKKTICILFNEGSGFYVEHQPQTGSPGNYNQALKTDWDTGSWPAMTEGHVKVLKESLDAVRTRTITVDQPAPASDD